MATPVPVQGAITASCRIGSGRLRLPTEQERHEPGQHGENEGEAEGHARRKALRSRGPGDWEQRGCRAFAQAPAAHRQGDEHREEHERHDGQKRAERQGDTYRPGAEGEGREVAASGPDAEEDLPPERAPLHEARVDDLVQERGPATEEPRHPRRGPQERWQCEAGGEGERERERDRRGPDEPTRGDPGGGEGAGEEQEHHDLPHQPLEHHGLPGLGEAGLPSAADGARRVAHHAARQRLVDHLREVVFPHRCADIDEDPEP
jgi:hypothetical protein